MQEKLEKINLELFSSSEKSYKINWIYNIKSWAKSMFLATALGTIHVLYYVVKILGFLTSLNWNRKTPILFWLKYNCSGLN